MSTSTIRALILAALVVLGVVGLTKLFPSNSSAGIATTPGTSTESPAASPSPSVSPTTPRKGQVKGVKVLVLNGGGPVGAAGTLADALNKAGYVATPQNAPQDRATTVVYYRADSQPEAKRLARKYLPGVAVQPAPGNLPNDTRVEIVLGRDYTGTPSPSA